MERSEDKSTFSAWRGIARSWFHLTRDEQKAVIVILVLFVLGLTARFWHLQKEDAEKASQFQKATKLVDSTAN